MVNRWRTPSFTDMRITRRRSVLAGALALVILAGCNAPMSQSEASGAPLASASGFGSEPSESEEPSASAPPAADVGVTGIWDGTWVIDPPYAEVSGGFTMDLVQSGSSFSGPVEITNTDCSNGTVEGSLNGSTINFGWVITPQPTQFTGTLNGSEMSGTWSALACSDSSLSLTGTWEATKRP